MILDVLSRLEAVLKDPTIGLDHHAQVVAAEKQVHLPRIPRDNIYGLGAPVNIDTVNVPGLVLGLGDGSAEPRSVGKRDFTFTAVAEWVTDNPNEAEWRTQAGHYLSAYLRILDRFNSANPTYAGDSCVILTSTFRFAFPTWQSNPNTRRGFFCSAEIQARDTFSGSS